MADPIPLSGHYGSSEPPGSFLETVPNAEPSLRKGESALAAIERVRGELVAR
jgi:hypothetical protein